MNIIKAMQTAFEHHQKNRFMEAESIYKKILKRNPEHFDALHMLGALYLQLGKFDLAKAYLERAISINQSNSIAHFNLGNVFLQMGRFENAIRSYQEVIKLNPVFAEAHFNLGNAFREKGRLDEAIHSYQNTVGLNPYHADAHYNLGNLFTISKNLEKAIESYNLALSINPKHADALLNRGFAYQSQGKMKEALENYHILLKINPDSLEACNNLGNLLKDIGQLHESEKCFRRAIQINPSFWIPYSNLLFLMNYDSRYDAGTIFSEHLQFAKRFEEPLQSAIMPHAEKCYNGSRLRIGYISPDLRKHSVAYFLESVFTAHDKKQFDIFCYSLVPVEDEVTARLRTYTDHWINISEMSDNQAAEIIRRDRIDILIDLAGHTANNRILLFARKPAPVQVSWIGYPATTGLSAMDYKIVDTYTDPPGTSENFYTEKLLRMPETFLCYVPDRESPDISPLPALSSGYVTFGSFNNFAKVTPEVTELWAKILKAVPGSRLLLKAKSLSSRSTREYVEDIFVTKGVAAERIELHAWQSSVQDHLSMYNHIDIELDTFPYNGTTTTCEALWMGVPVISLSGSSHASRVGLSLLSNAGIPGLVAKSCNEYFEIAVALATDMNRLKSLRENLRDMMRQSPLTNAERFTKNLEINYRIILNNWCSSG